MKLLLDNGWTVDVIVHILHYASGITTEPLEVLSMYDGMSCGHLALDKLGDAFQVRKDGWALDTQGKEVGSLMQYNAIPAELKEEKAWVNVWNNSKIPMQSSARKAASSSLPDTWSEYGAAVAAVERGQYDGLGYVFHDTGLVGIDIDAGFDDCFLSRLAIDIVGHCQSYTEKSRSGRGVHVLVRGQLPFKGRNNRAGVEIYQSGRYFIMTGKVLVYSEIIENQAAIDYVLEHYFPDVPRESAGAALLERIYTPVYPKPAGGKVSLRPEYPPILPGARNTSLTSLAGQLHNQGYGRADIYRELLHCNAVACQPPLPRSEVEHIVTSISRYRR